MNKKTKYLIPLILALLSSFLLAGCLPKDMGSIQQDLDRTLNPVAVNKDTQAGQPVINFFSDSKGNVQFFSEVNDDFSENQPLGRFSVTPGELIDFEIDVVYEGDIFYRFGYVAIETEESPYILLRDWSGDNTFSWQIPDDIPLGVMIVAIAQIKNDDGIEKAGNSIMGFCDDSAVLTYMAK
jgi:hypothetical protein